MQVSWAFWRLNSFDGAVLITSNSDVILVSQGEPVYCVKKSK